MLRNLIENLRYRFWEWLTNWPDLTGEPLLDAVGQLAIPNLTKRSHGLLIAS